MKKMESLSKFKLTKEMKSMVSGGQVTTSYSVCHDYSMQGTVLCDDNWEKSDDEGNSLGSGTIKYCN